MSLVNYVYSLEQSDLNTFSIWTKFVSAEVSAIKKQFWYTLCSVVLFYTKGDEIEHVLHLTFVVVSVLCL